MTRFGAKVEVSYLPDGFTYNCVFALSKIMVAQSEQIVPQASPDAQSSLSEPDYSSSGPTGATIRLIR
jgi:hypothetical protein